MIKELGSILLVCSVGGLGRSVSCSGASNAYILVVVAVLAFPG